MNSTKNIAVLYVGGIGPADPNLLHPRQTFGRFFQPYSDIRLEVFHVSAGEAAPDPARCDGFIITGSAANVYETGTYPWIRAVMDYTERAWALDKRGFGTCFGAQVAAVAAGGRVERNSKGRGIGIHTYALTDEGKRLLGDPADIRLIALHEDWISQLPVKSKILMRSDFCEHAAYLYDRLFLGVQAHPEMPPEIALRITENWHREKPTLQEFMASARDTFVRLKPDEARFARLAHSFLAHGLG